MWKLSCCCCGNCLSDLSGFDVIKVCVVTLLPLFLFLSSSNNKHSFRWGMEELSFWFCSLRLKTCCHPDDFVKNLVQFSFIGCTLHSFNIVVLCYMPVVYRTPDFCQEPSVFKESNTAMELCGVTANKWK